MSGRREQVLTALFTLLETSLQFKTFSRRLVRQENVTPAMSPALFLVSHEDDYVRDVIAAPPKRDLKPMIVLYNNAGNDPNAVPEAPINEAIDVLDTLFNGDNALVRKNTLGGLVEACFIEGTIVRGSGDVTGFGSAIIPIRIILP